MLWTLKKLVYQIKKIDLLSQQLTNTTKAVSNVHIDVLELDKKVNDVYKGTIDNDLVFLKSNKEITPYLLGLAGLNFASFLGIIGLFFLILEGK